jgi:hypothetical protein
MRQKKFENFSIFYLQTIARAIRSERFGAIRTAAAARRHASLTRPTAANTTPG